MRQNFFNTSAKTWETK